MGNPRSNLSTRCMTSVRKRVISVERDHPNNRAILPENNNPNQKAKSSYKGSGTLSGGFETGQVLFITHFSLTRLRERSAEKQVSRAQRMLENPTARRNWSRKEVVAKVAIPRAQQYPTGNPRGNLTTQWTAKVGSNTANVKQNNPDKGKT